MYAYPSANRIRAFSGGSSGGNSYSPLPAEQRQELFLAGDRERDDRDAVFERGREGDVPDDRAVQIQSLEPLVAELLLDRVVELLDRLGAAEQFGRPAQVGEQAVERLDLERDGRISRRVGGQNRRGGEQCRGGQHQSVSHGELRTGGRTGAIIRPGFAAVERGP
jgi:hypothetical protein